MKYTEYSFEHFDSSGVNKVQKWIDGPSVDYLDYTVSRNNNYRLSYYDLKSLVFNYVRNNERNRVFDILKNSTDLNYNYIWDILLDYNINSTHKSAIVELAKFLLDNKFYPTINQLILIVSLDCEDMNTLIKSYSEDFHLTDLVFEEYLKLIGPLNTSQTELLEAVGFKKNNDWDTTIKTLKENNMVGVKNSRRYKNSWRSPIDYFWDDKVYYLTY